MIKFINIFETHFSSFLIFISFALAASTIFSKGDPSIFFTPVWVTVFFISGIYLVFITFVKLLKRNYLQGLTLLSATVLLAFCMLNFLSFEHEYLSVREFNTSRSQLLENDRIMLLEHGFGDTQKLKNYEKATFLSNGEEVSVELNRPLNLNNSRKLLLTGTGENFLITRSPFLYEILFAALTTIFLSVIIIGKKWTK